MIYAFLILFSATSLCLGLNTRLSTRVLGMLSALAALAAGGVLFTERFLTTIAAGHGATVSTTALTCASPFGNQMVWAILDQMIVFIPTHLDPLSHTLAIVVLGGGAIALWSLALALDPSVRGFGSLFAWALLALAATMMGLAGSGVFIAFAWGIAVLTSYGTVRASRALVQQKTAPLGLLMGILATLLLTGSIIALQTGFFAAQAPSRVGITGIIIACLLLAGSVPFHNTLDEVVKAPAALSGLLAGLVLPMLAIATLLRVLWTPNMVFASLPLTLPDFWRTPLLLLATMSMIISASAALSEYRLRRIIGWQMSGQIALVLVAISTASSVGLAGLATTALLVNAALTTLAASLAAGILEHVTGSDDCTQDVAGKPGVVRALRVPGLVWLFAALSALGLPPFLGFWGRYWLVDAVKEQAPWSIPLILAASSLAALAYLVPLAQFWRAGSQPHRGRPQQDGGRVAVAGGMLLQDSNKPGDTGGLKVQGGGGGMQVKESSTTTRLPHYLSPITYIVLPLLAILPLFVLGIMPQIATQPAFFLVPLRVGDSFPVAPVSIHVGMGLWAIVVLVVVVVGSQVRWKRRTLTDEDMVPIALTPDTLANSLFPLVWAGRPSSLLRGLGNILMLVNRGVRLVLSPFEQRYYLAGVLLALISLIVFMAQS